MIGNIFINFHRKMTIFGQKIPIFRFFFHRIHRFLLLTSRQMTREVFRRERRRLSSLSGSRWSDEDGTDSTCQSFRWSSGLSGRLAGLLSFWDSHGWKFIFGLKMVQNSQKRHFQCEKSMKRNELGSVQFKEQSSSERRRAKWSEKMENRREKRGELIKGKGVTRNKNDNVWLYFREKSRRKKWGDFEYDDGKVTENGKFQRGIRVFCQFFELQIFLGLKFLFLRNLDRKNCLLNNDECLLKVVILNEDRVSFDAWNFSENWEIWRALNALSSIKIPFSRYKLTQKIIESVINCVQVGNFSFNDCLGRKKNFLRTSRLLHHMCWKW